MSSATVTIAPGVVVGKISHGLMMMTAVRAAPLPDEQCFESIKAGVDSLPSGVKMFLNSGEFYGPELGTGNLEMLSRFYEKYPEYVDRTFLSVKGGANKGTHEINSSPENLRRSVDACIAALRGKKKIDLFQSARVDPKVPLEEAMGTLKTFISEGKFDYIGMSECSAATLQKAAKAAPIAAVEIEISPMSYEEETKKVIAAAKDLGIAVLGYSPVARGLLTMTITSIDDLEAGDRRRHLTRFQGDYKRTRSARLPDLTRLAHSTMSATTVTIRPGVTVGKVAHGLMGMHWVPTAVSDEQCFEAIKAGIDSLPSGVKMVLNSGEFYAQDLGTGNLEMISRFFEKYPDYADRAFLSVKGGTKKGTVQVDSTPENLRRSVDACNAALRGKKRMDLFESARVDPNIPIEEAVKTLKTLVDEGKFDHIGMSECNAATLRRAATVATITAVEIEISPMSYEEETKRVIAAAKELGIAVMGYSPVARGILSMKVTNLDNLEDGDRRKHMTRFEGDNLAHHLKIAETLKGIAAKKNATPAQLSIAWVSALGPHIIPLPGSSKASRTVENAGAVKFSLSEAEVNEISAVVDQYGVIGGRYFNAPPDVLRLWG